MVVRTGGLYDIFPRLHYIRKKVLTRFCIGAHDYRCCPHDISFHAHAFIKVAYTYFVHVLATFVICVVRQCGLWECGYYSQKSFVGSFENILLSLLNITSSSKSAGIETVISCIIENISIVLINGCKICLFHIVSVV